MKPLELQSCFASGIGHVLGIDIGANKVLVVAADLAGEVLAVERRKTGVRRGDPDALLALVDDAVSSALDSAGIPAESLKAVVSPTGTLNSLRLWMCWLLDAIHSRRC